MEDSTLAASSISTTNRPLNTCHQIESRGTELMNSAERELSAFIAAVTTLFGEEQAKLSAEDWLDESASIDITPQSTCRDWRTVTIAASARLASRLSVASP
jgi:hypothetical protein